MKIQHPSKLFEIAEKIPDSPLERIPNELKQNILSKKFKFDVHVHIFNADFIPEKYFGIRIPYMVNPEFLEYIDKVLPEVSEFQDDKLRSYAYFIDFATHNSMEEIAQYLIQNSSPGTIFIPIALDLNQAIEGKTAKNYIQQLQETAIIRDKYPQYFLPFFEFNPTNPDFEQIFDLALNKLKFFGIKIYPAFGYLPTHPTLMELFEICEQKNIPVITHSGTEGAHTSQNFLTLNFYESDIYGNLKLRKIKKVFMFKNQFIKFFNKPQNWEPVLRLFPKLRINFAHFGGDDDWDNNPKTDKQWSLRIIDLMERYENVYADISYTFHIKQMPATLKNLLKSNSLVADRILYGSDFYMITAEGKYKDFRSRLFTELGSDFTKKITIQNPINFLGLNSLFD